jgi:hypothetical protein
MKLFKPVHILTLALVNTQLITTMILRRVSRIGPLTSGVLSQTMYALAFHLITSLPLPVQLQQQQQQQQQ